MGGIAIGAAAAAKAHGCSLGWYFVGWHFVSLLIREANRQIAVSWPLVGYRMAVTLRRELGRPT